MSNYTETRQTNNQKISRTQIITSAEKLILHMCGKDAYARWLAALPPWVELSSLGGVSNQSAMAIAENEDEYETMIKVFAKELLPVMQAVEE